MRNSFRLPWFRVHIILLNDPGRLISVHLMHTSLVSGWSSVMSLYELLIFDPSDPIYNPIWRQGSFVLPFVTRLGVNTSIFDWCIGAEPLYYNTSFNVLWKFESVSASHLILAGLLSLSSFWHWSFWDLKVFISNSTAKLSLDLVRIFGIHLLLAGLLCFGFGTSHLSGLFGPGFWTSDNLGLVGAVRQVKPVYSIIGLNPSCFGSVPANHISAGFLGLVVGVWQISSRPGPSLYTSLNLSSLESVLSSSIGSVLFTGILTSSLMWYGSVTNPLELFGPSRFQWDNGYFSLDIERRVKGNSAKVKSPAEIQLSWEEIPDKLVIYDYIGANPAKGGLFRAGPLVKGDGIIQNWVGHTFFESGTLSLTVRRMPAFFETFPVVLVDQGGSVRADIPFRRAESRYSVEQVNLLVYFYGGVLNNVEYSSPSIVKSYARKAQLGEIFTFDKLTVLSDGVFRSSSRGWYSLAHVVFSMLFLLGHLWHAGRALFKDIWTGLSVTSVSIDSIEYGRFKRLGEVD
jgi:photosystem II CP47 chlorophyll apoprotein